ncbi:TlpA disulfide reductase family protein [Piscinibacter sp. XHJ-5]|uniref:TlpA family protein disulfide reductase n=1 Tax=Piscinibacter sp. XHJ-5 TaxID=3037797 RepID=UPI002452F285|nr:TlpA disulfide reductase family protein [Piscinibacter sp. XHJ-5]
MTRILLLWMALAVLPAHAVAPGDPAPDFQLAGLRGPVSLADFKGKLTYVDFWASWCAACKQSFPWMNEMQARYGANGFQVVGINLDRKREDADRFLAERPAAFAIAFDAGGESARRYGVKGMPTSVLVSPEGRVLFVHSGFRPEQQQALEARIAAALGSK